jgi:ribosomal RNA-processing protein 9
MRERCVTAGGRDGSLRLWKIVEESHLMFTGHKYIINPFFLKRIFIV